MNKLVLVASAVLCTVLVSAFSSCEMSSSTEMSGDFVSEESHIETNDISVSFMDSTVEEKEEFMSKDDIELIALATMAEAEDECEEGKRLVIDTILNRVDSDKFPNTVYDVIYQPYQFPSMTNGRADICEVRDDICNLVEEELETRRNFDCIFFSPDGYSEYGVPMFQVENHYFSSYE